MLNLKVHNIFRNKYILFFVAFFKFRITYPVNIYLFKVNNRNTREKCEICSKLTKKHQTDVIDAVLVFFLLTLNIFHAFF